MDREPSAATVANAVLSSPVWARQALLDMDVRAAERGADVIAARVLACMAEPDGTDPRQLNLDIL